MTRFTLKKLLTKRRKVLRDALGDVMALAGEPLGVVDETGRVLLGQMLAQPEGVYPVEADGVEIGQVLGGQGARALASVLNYAAQSEVEKRLLGAEALHRYRELNLFYTISEELVTRTGLKAMGALVIEEVQKLIDASGGAVMVRQPDTDRLQMVASFGLSDDADPLDWPACHAVIESVRARGSAEVINDMRDDPRCDRVGQRSPAQALICAPMRLVDKEVGMLVLYCDRPASYAADDLNLLATLAAQTAPAFEHTLAYEHRLKNLESELLDLCTDIDGVTKFVSMSDITQTAYFKELQRKAQRTQQRRQADSPG